MSTRTTLSELNGCSTAAFAARVGDVWEHAPWVAEAAAQHRPYACVDAMHRTMVSLVRALPEPALLSLLAGHPDLAGSDARTGRMTADSIQEQGALSLEQVDGGEAARWDAMNAAYRARFGFPFILCVKRHTRASVLRTFEQRLQNDRAAELENALQEIGRITRLRLAARIAGHGLDGIAGRLTTCVLDGSDGEPAAGIKLSLHELSDGATAPATRLVAEAVTDERGQTREPLIGGEPLRTGRYEMRFHVEDYYRRQGMAGGDRPFLGIVPVVFDIAEPEGDYHVPLTVTPWTCATGGGA